MVHKTNKIFLSGNMVWEGTKADVGEGTTANLGGEGGFLAPFFYFIVCCPLMEVLPS